MSKTATLKGKISLDDTEFHKVLRRATDRIKKFGSDAAKYAAETAGKYAKLGLVSLGTAGLGAAAGLLAAAKSAADLGGQLSDTNAVTDIATDKLLVMQQAFANAGMEAGNVQTVIAKMQAAIGKAGFQSEDTQEEVSKLQEQIDQLQASKRGVLSPEATSEIQLLRDQIKQLRQSKYMGLSGEELKQVNSQIAEAENRIKQIQAKLAPKEILKINKEIAKATEKLNDLKGSGKGAQEAMRRLGLDADMLRNMDGADMLVTLMEALGKVSSQSEKLAILKLMKVPPDIMVLAKDPNAFKAATTQLGRMVDLFGDPSIVSAFDRISDIFNAKPGILFKQIGAGFLKELTGSKTLNEALDWFEALDLTSIGEKIGAQAAALVEIVRSTIENNGQGIWGALAAGMDFLSAKAMETFIYVSQLAAGAAMGVFQTIFSEKGGELAQSFAGLLTGAVLLAGVQIKRGLEGLIALAENDLKGSTLGKALLSVNSLAKSVMPFGRNRIEHLKNAFSSATYEQKPREQIMADIQANMNKPIDFLEMTPQALVQSTVQKAGDLVTDTAAFMQSLATNIKDKIAEVRAMQGVNPATATAAEKYNNLIRAAGPQGPSLYNQLLNGTPGVPIIPSRSQQFNRAPVPGMQWTYPNGNTNKVSGDTGAKQVSLLEQVASLLERNLTAMQVA